VSSEQRVHGQLQEKIRYVQYHRLPDLRTSGTSLPSLEPPRRVGTLHPRACGILRAWNRKRSTVANPLEIMHFVPRTRIRSNADHTFPCRSGPQLMHSEHNPALTSIVNPLEDELPPFARSAPVNQALGLGLVPDGVAARNKLPQEVGDVVVRQPAVDGLVVEQARRVGAPNVQPEYAVHAAVVAHQVAPQLCLLCSRRFDRLPRVGGRERVEGGELIICCRSGGRCHVRWLYWKRELRFELNSPAAVSTHCGQLGVSQGVSACYKGSSQLLKVTQPHRSVFLREHDAQARETARRQGLPFQEGRAPAVVAKRRFGTIGKRRGRWVNCHLCANNARLQQCNKRHSKVWTNFGAAIRTARDPMRNKHPMAVGVRPREQKHTPPNL
jgi:hypothetical protein